MTGSAEKNTAASAADFFTERTAKAKTCGFLEGRGRLLRAKPAGQETFPRYRPERAATRVRGARGAEDQTCRERLNVRERIAE